MEMMSHGNCHRPCGGMNDVRGMQDIPQAEPVICPPEYCVRDEFMPRIVPVIHPIVNVNRQHYVDVPRHYFTETTETVMGAPVNVQGGFGPQFGGPFNPAFGPGSMFDQGFGRGF